MEKPAPKKRGRKPKGGKIVKNEKLINILIFLSFSFIL